MPICSSSGIWSGNSDRKGLSPFRPGGEFHGAGTGHRPDRNSQHRFGRRGPRNSRGGFRANLAGMQTLLLAQFGCVPYSALTLARSMVPSAGVMIRTVAFALLTATSEAPHWDR